MKRNLRASANRGFTIVELIVVVTVIGLLAAIAVGAYNKVVNDAKSAKALALVNTLSTAKSLFVSDPNTTETGTQSIQGFNGATGDTQYGMIAKYVRVNGTEPTTVAQLLQLSGLPATVTVTLGTVEDDTQAPPIPDTAPTVTGYP
jgi:type IV pilus assembly protein PilA